MKEFLKDFKKFVMRGNVLDLAVAVIIGIAFGAVIKSLVDDVIMPFVGAIFGKASFQDLTLSIGDGVIRYGAFINTVINFLIIAFVLFLVIRLFEKMKSMRGADEEAEPLTVGEELLTEIRDILKTNRSG
ncbi:MAG: large conductance mechanosensitive channel protein MscL [Acidimicrobiia bacterium]